MINHELTAFIYAEMKRQRATEFAASPQLSLGEFIDSLAEIENQAKPVIFDFPGGTVGTFDSYRGIYAELALSHDGKNNPTVADLIALANAADGATYDGYKGGEFTMDRGTPVWVANYGLSSSTMIVGVSDWGWCAVIHTQYGE